MRLRWIADLDGGEGVPPEPADLIARINRRTAQADPTDADTGAISRAAGAKRESLVASRKRS
jgi:hypothetical protein